MLRSGYTIDDFISDIKNRRLRIDDPRKYNANEDWPEGHLGTYLHDMRVDGNPDIKNELTFIFQNLKNKVIIDQVLSISQLSQEEVEKIYSDLKMPITGGSNRIIESVLKNIVDWSIERTSLIIWEQAKIGNFNNGKEEAFLFAEKAIRYINSLLEESEKKVPQELGNDLTKPDRLRPIFK